MARLEIQGDMLVVCSSLGEKFAAVKLRRPKVRLAAVRSARVVQHPFEELRGIRAPGLGVPGSIALDTWRSRRGRDFVAVYRGRPAVIVELEGGALPSLRDLGDGSGGGRRGGLRAPARVGACAVRRHAYRSRRTLLAAQRGAT